MDRHNPPAPHELLRAATESRGVASVEWLQRLPALVAECARQWRLGVGPPFAGLSYNWVAPVVREDGGGAVLKLCVPDREFFTEAEALRLCDGEGMVRLLAVDFERGALLLERIEPGTRLVELTDDHLATSAAVGVMRALHRPAPPAHGFPTVADWAKGLSRLRARFDGGSGPLPARLVEQVEALFADLLASMASPVLLHGDLHHDNILAARRAPWLAIDPKGVVGEPAYETGALLRNPMPRILHEPDVRCILARRVRQLADELSLDRQRILGWGIAQAVLSACWSLEDHGAGWEHGIGIAEHLNAVQSGNA